MCKTDYGGGGGKNVPKIDYVICERPLGSFTYYVISRGGRVSKCLRLITGGGGGGGFGR